jgi:hypothetical protein
MKKNFKEEGKKKNRKGRKRKAGEGKFTEELEEMEDDKEGYKKIKISVILCRLYI